MVCSAMYKDLTSKNCAHQRNYITMLPTYLQSAEVTLLLSDKNDPRQRLLSYRGDSLLELTYSPWTLEALLYTFRLWKWNEDIDEQGKGKAEDDDSEKDDDVDANDDVDDGPEHIFFIVAGYRT